VGDLRSRAADLFRLPCTYSEGDGPILELIRRYSAGGPWNDPELQNLLSTCIRTAQAKAARPAPATYPELDAWHFYQRAAAILQEIQAEAPEERQ
jgi:hypothetical protein